MFYDIDFSFAKDTLALNLCYNDPRNCDTSVGHMNVAHMLAVRGSVFANGTMFDRHFMIKIEKQSGDRYHNNPDYAAEHNSDDFQYLSHSFLSNEDLFELYLFNKRKYN